MVYIRARFFMNRLTQPLIFAVVLVAFATIQSCGKHEISKDGSKQSSSASTSPDSNAVKAPPKPENIEKVCKKYFDIMKMALALQAEGREKNYNSIVQNTFENFASSFKSLKVTPLKMEDEPDCATLQSYAKSVDQSEIPSLYETYKKNYRWLKDGKKFNSMGFVMESLLGIFARSLDEFSFFGGYYTNFFSDQGPYDWQIQLLKRSDYQQIDVPLNSPSQRKPNYLFVEYSPSYLASSLPLHSRIYKVNNMDVSSNLYSTLAKEMTRSEVLNLQIKTPKADGTYSDLTMVRLEYKNPSNSHEIIFQVIENKPYKIGYLKIPGFMNSESEIDLFKSLDPKNNPRMDGVILDLRNNYGGDLEIGSKIIASFFKEPVTYSYTVHNDKLEENRVKDPYNPIFYGKVIILTDFQTISTAEIVTAALKDYGAALVVGESTYGKGIGQSYLPKVELGDYLDGRLAITNLFAFSPKGESWYPNGNQPDIFIHEKYDPKYAATIEKRMKDLPVSRYPKPYDKKIHVDYDPNVGIASDRVTADVKQKLLDFYNSSDPEEKNCAKMDSTIEENSCIYSWGIKILKKWIEIQPTANSLQ